jgi:hypothetical protein
MNDQNKVAIFCILLVIAFSIWSKNDESVPAVGDDVFQTTQSDQNYSFVSLPKDNEAVVQKMSRLKVTVREDFEGDPFQ